MRKLRTFARLALRRDSLLLFHLLTRIGSLLVPQYRFCWPQLAWWDSNEFNSYLVRFDELKSNNSDRHWMLSELLKLVTDLTGDTAECGVFKGASSYLMALANQNSLTQRTHHIFDSFAGLSLPSLQDGNFWSQGDLSCSMEIVKQNLSQFPPNSIKYYPGWIPDRFSELDDSLFSFVHIDVDLYKPTFDSLAFFYPRMLSGGIILCDDYGFTSCPGATAAFDEYLSNKPEPLIALSSGGAFLIKS